MKLHLNKVLTPVTALAVSWSFIACEKPAEKPAEPKSEQPAKAPEAKAPEAPKPAEAPKAAEAVKAAVEKVAPAPASDIAKMREIYGFAVRLPKDVETFSATYRMHDLWASIANSKWAAAFVELAKKDAQMARTVEQWNSPEAAKAKEIAEAFLGNEFFFAGAAGMAEKLGPWVELQQQIGMIQLQALVTGQMSGGGAADANKALLRAMKDNAGDLLPKATKLEVPPILIGFKAGKVRAEFDKAIDGLLKSGNLPPGVEDAKFKVADKYDFQSLSVIARKVIPQVQEANMLLQFKEILGDEAAAKAAVDALMAKRVEISWGWVEDYLVVSLGSDHAHVKLAATDADSALSIPEVSARASVFAGKQPVMLGYGSKALFDKMSKPVEFAKAFAEMTGGLAGILKPEALSGMNADVKRMEGKVQALFQTVNTPQVDVGYLDGGIRFDVVGGPRPANAGASQALAFSSLSTPTTAVSLVANSVNADSSKTSDLIEEGAGMVWGWFDKYGRTMVPEDGKQNVAMVEAMALPMVKEFWKSCRLLGKSFGTNSAVLVDLNGAMPPLPNAPKSAIDGGKMPRLAIAMDLKDRAALSEAWKGFEKIIKQGLALVPQGADAPPVPEVKKEDKDGVEIHFVDLPIKMGDLLPHVAISKDKWILSTSPSYSVELSKLPAAGTAKLDGSMRIDFGAVSNFAEHWLKLAASNPGEFFPQSGQAEEFAKNKPTVDAVMKLVRAFKSMDVQMGEEGGKPHATMSLQVEDLK